MGVSEIIREGWTLKTRWLKKRGLGLLKTKLSSQSRPRAKSLTRAREENEKLYAIKV
jgi:hypothetical protein